MSSIVRTAVVGVEPVSLAEMRNFLRVQDSVTSDDTLISSMITAARVQAETITECALVRSAFTQYLDRFPHWRVLERGHYFGRIGRMIGDHHTHRGEIKLGRYPLISVQSVKYIGTDGVSHTLNAGTDFVVDPARMPGRIRPIPYTAWPLTMRTLNAVAIAFTAGYGAAATSQPETVTEGNVPVPPEQQATYTVDWTLPPTVKIGIMHLVAHWYFNREPVVDGTVSELPKHMSNLFASATVVDLAPTPDDSD